MYLLQRFDFVMDDPSYDLQLKQTLTIKPNNFYIHAIPRSGKPALLATPSSGLLSSPDQGRQRNVSPKADEGMTPLYTLYGSNTGTCEAFAQRIASVAAGRGKSVSSWVMYVIITFCRFPRYNWYPGFCCWKSSYRWTDSSRHSVI